MQYTSNDEIKLRQVALIHNIIRKLEAVENELLSYHCPSSGGCQEFHYARNMMACVDKLDAEILQLQESEEVA